MTVRTDADQVSVAPAADAAAGGVRVTDEKGVTVTDAADGDRLYFDVPKDTADGTASLGVQATASVPVGRAFAGTDRTQTQILAGSSESTVTARATATWAETGAAPALTARKNCAEGGWTSRPPTGATSRTPSSWPGPSTPWPPGRPAR